MAPSWLFSRIAAQRVLADRNEGKDPAGAKRDLRKKVVTGTLEDVTKEYRLRKVNALWSAYETNRVNDRELLSRWKDKSIHEISRRDILSALEEVMARGSSTAYKYARGHSHLASARRNHSSSKPTRDHYDRGVDASYVRDFGKLLDGF